MPLKTRLFVVLLLIISFSAWFPLLYADYHLRRIRNEFCHTDNLQEICSLMRIDVPGRGAQHQLLLYGYWQGKPFRLRAN